MVHFATHVEKGLVAPVTLERLANVNRHVILHVDDFGPADVTRLGTVVVKVFDKFVVFQRCLVDKSLQTDVAGQGDDVGMFGAVFGDLALVHALAANVALLTVIIGMNGAMVQVGRQFTCRAQRIWDTWCVSA